MRKLESEFRESGMLVRPTTKWPVELPIGLGDRQVVDACDAAPHETLLVKLPVLIPVRTVPVSAANANCFHDYEALACPSYAPSSRSNLMKTIRFHEFCLIQSKFILIVFITL